MRRSTTTENGAAPGSSARWLRALFGGFVKRMRLKRQLGRRRVAELPEDRLEGIEIDQIAPNYRDIQALTSALDLPQQELLEVAGYVAPKRE